MKLEEIRYLPDGKILLSFRVPKGGRSSPVKC